MLPEEPQHDAGEVWADRTGDISVWNKYFEKVNIRLFSAIITEKGLFEVKHFPWMGEVDIHPWLKF